MPKKNKNPLTGLEIAVLGMAGKFPGAANIDEFWKNLKNGKETISFFSNKELEDAGIDSLLINRANYIKAKGFIEDIEYFDAAFFGYTSEEAHIMDPQIRLMHECSWEALENAGYDPYIYKGQIGIYAGATFNANWLSYFAGNPNAAFRIASGSLCNKDALCSLIAYKLNLRGPSLTLYTACSTSLVAIHQACRSLLTGECQIALAGGVSVSLPRKSGYLYEPGMILSPDGHCRVFDKDARGTVFGDGVGVVVLKRLDEAMEDGDNIYAVVKASVVNNDGFRKAGYTAPSVEGQEEAVLAALHMAEVEPESITYIEAHSIGDSIGDAVEIEALGRVFNTGKKQYCAVGSVKTNVGHLDVAAGMAAFIKTALALTHRLIPPTLHFKIANPEIDFENSAFYVNTGLIPWENGSCLLRAGISASGIGGSNVYLILEEPPISVFSEMSRNSHLLLLSARGEFALERAIFNFCIFLKKNPRLNLADAAYTLQVGRHEFSKRIAMVCRDNRDAIDILERRDFRHLFTGSHIDRSVIFMFPGQGTEYSHMAWELYRDEPLFKKHMDRCAEIIKSISGHALIDAIYPRSQVKGKKHGREIDTNAKGVPLDQVQVDQLALFTVEYALASLWMDWGIRPRGMIGYGLGEFVAATIAGVFTLEDALLALWDRCRLMKLVPEGRMLAVVLGEKSIRSFIDRNIWLVAVNTPSLCIASGTTAAVQQMEKKLTAGRISFIPLKTQWPMHSGMLDDILEPHSRIIKKFLLKSPQIPFISCLTGQWITPGQAADPAFWLKQMRRTVLFSRGIRELLKEPNRILLEVGPGDTLKRLAKEHIQYNEHRGHNRILTSLRRSDEVESDQAYLLKTLGRLWVSGVSPDWENFNRGQNRHRMPLPTYPFEKERYWIEEKKSQPREYPIPGNKIEPVSSYRLRPVLSVIYTPPISKIETLISSIWEDVFNIQPIGVFDNFFELGGNSLIATLIAAHIQRNFEVNIPVKGMFDHPTIRQLAGYIEDSAREDHSVIELVEKRQYYPLSSAQKRLYYLWQLDNQSTAYNMPVVKIVEGEIDRKKCEAVFKLLIRRHESTRTSFHNGEDFPVQVVHDDMSFGIEYYDPGDLNDVEHERPGGQIESYLKHFVRPFDLARAPLLRVRLVKLSPQRQVLLFDMHHIISDGTSMNILIKDYMSLYVNKVLSPLKIQYKDFVFWQERLKEYTALQEQEAYWEKEFEKDVPILNLPEDYARNCLAPGNTEGEQINFELDHQETLALNQLAAAGGASLFMILLAIFNILLAKLSGQEDIVVGSPIAGRRHIDTHQVMGIFINTLALRNFPSAEKTFLNFLGEVKEQAFKAFDNQDYQFEDLAAKTGISYDRNRNPLFDVMLVLQNTGEAEIEIPGLKLKPFQFKNWTAKFDITWNVSEMEGRLYFQVLYRSCLFKRESIRRFIKYFKKIVISVTQYPDLQISEIEVITAEEKEKILLRFNNSDTVFPRDKLLHQLFEEQVNRTPDHVAVVGSTVGPRAASLQISYRELAKKTNRLARLLRQKGIVPGMIAAIMMGRSINLVVGLLAVLKTGAAYLPIDPNFPGIRIKFILADSLPGIVLINEHFYTNFQNDLPDSINKSSIFIMAARENYEYENMACSPLLSESLDIVNNPRDPAYIIYTSGTTGKPRGVPVEHRSAVNVVAWFGKKYRLRSGIHVLQMSDYIFDASVNQIFGALLHGAAVHEINKELIVDSEALREYIDARQVQVINFVPIFLRQLLGHGPKLKSLQTVISGADTLNDFTKDVILAKGYRLYNQYGPTETTIDALAGKCSRRKVNLGTPIANVHCYIIDKNTKLCPIGLAGELYIGGEGVSRGYLNNPLLTAEKFIYLNFLHPERLYRSGDLARWLANGEIEFLGRIDEQVKIKGCRIELEDIRSQLLATGYIQEAVVLAGQSLKGGVYDEENDEKYLAAYIVSDTPVNPADLKNYLSQRLPAFMLPDYVIQVDKIPLTNAGKVDRNALPEPGKNFADNFDNYIPPQGEIEEKLAAIWANILGKHHEIIGRNCHFFELGGHSLKATQLISWIHKTFAVKLSLQQVFAVPVLMALANYIRAASPEKYTALEPAEKKCYYAVSSAQERLYVLYKMEETNTAYNMPAVTILAGTVDREKLERTFLALLRRHESLRTSFQLLNGKLVQKIHDHVEFKISYRDLQAGDGDRPVHGETLIQEFIRPFELTRAPLLRVELLKIKENNYWLMVDMHHIISDGISVARLINEFMAIYGGSELPVLKFQYKDYVQWLESIYSQQFENITKQEAYWKNQFAGEIPVLHLPFDYPRPKFFNFAGAKIRFQVSPEQTQVLQKIALQEGATLFMVLLGVSYIFFARLSGQEDIIIGTPTAGRRHADLQHIIGMFVNTLAIRGYPHGRMAVRNFLKEIKQRTLGAFENQDYHFEKLVNQLVMGRDAGRNPLFDVMFTLQNLEIPEIELPQLKLIPYPLERAISLFDLSIIVQEKEGQLQFIFEYNTHLFKQETIQRFSGYFKQLLAALPDNVEKMIGQLEYLPPGEKEQLLFLFNETHFPYQWNLCIHGLLEEKVEKIPSHIVMMGAVEMSGRYIAQVSYKELNDRANIIARILKAHGVKLETVVGAAARRSIETVTGIFGILKAGAVYLPIDCELPQERINYMLKDSGAGILLNVQNKKLHCETATTFVLNFEHIDFEPVFTRDFEFPNPDINAANLAYIIYTSGSTGRPKGVMVEHRPVVNRLSWINQQYKFDSREIVLQKTPLIFDVSLCELFHCLPGGGKIFLLPEGKEKEQRFMIETTAKYRITTIDFTPPMLDIFLDYIDNEGSINKVASLRWVFVGGEMVFPEVVEKFNRLLLASNATQLINAYGPTETTIDVTAFNCSLEKFRDNVPIGTPIGNTCIYILDNYGNLQPIGVIGELCIGGESVARGYLNNPELTAEKFNRSYRSYKTYILYKTGDLARRLPDGNIEFTGRVDRQVKIRGMRIELGEIEIRLLKYKKVKEAVVLAKKDKQEAVYLGSYIVPMTSETSLTANELKEYLAGFLPNYMIPAFFIFIEKIPLTSTGKLDRNALPEPSFSEKTGKEAFVPVSAEEKILLEVWIEVLGIQRPGLHDNFFELGGDSIKAIQLAARLHKRGFILQLVDIFLFPRLSELTGHMHRVNKIPQHDNAGQKPGDLTDEELFIIKRKIADIDWPGEFS